MRNALGFQFSGLEGRRRSPVTFPSRFVRESRLSPRAASPFQENFLRSSSSLDLSHAAPSCTPKCHDPWTEVWALNGSATFEKQSRDLIAISANLNGRAEDDRRVLGQWPSLRASARALGSVRAVRLGQRSPHPG